MSDTTITIRGVDSKTWKEFQSGIVILHGNLYGNIGQEVTNALELWLKRRAGRASAVGVPADSLSVSYSDIGGLRKEIKIMKETVEMPLRHPELFRWLNLIPSKGILIHGPPGTGKNLLAKVAAAGAKAQLFTLKMQRMVSEPNEMGLREVFRKSKESAPSVILIPDLGSIASSRHEASTDNEDKIISWLLSEMDALENFSRVVVIGITSSPEELDSSLRQRFKQQIEVSFPDRQGRYEILKIITSEMPLADDVDLERLADMTDNYQGSLLWRICQEAATQTLRRTLEHEKVTDEEIAKERLEQVKVGMDDFLYALSSVKPPPGNL